MRDAIGTDHLDVGFDVPARIGMDASEIQTPCLVLDLDALERNIAKMGELARRMGVRHRIHAKMHKSIDIALLQEKLGGSCGVCCQKVSEAEVFVRGGIEDVLVSNQVRDPAKIDRLARLPKHGARILVCVDDIGNVAELSAAAARHGTAIECLVEIDCGAGAVRRHRSIRCRRHRPGGRRGRGAEIRRHPGLSGRDAAHRAL